MKKLLYLLSVLFMVACSANLPEKELIPSEPGNDAQEEMSQFETRIGFSVDVSEENVTKSSATRVDGNSNDLIGVSILHLSKNQFGGKDAIQYAYGVFDDLNAIIFKLNKDQLYQIQLTYYPNAKDIVYKYSNGTYGVPFNDPYLPAPAYKLNVPAYHSQYIPGFQQLSVLKNIYQYSERNYDADCKRGTTPIFMGVKEVCLTEPGDINIELANCLMGIKLNCANFTEGNLTLEYEQVGEHRTVNFKPEDELTDWVQITIPYCDYHVNSGDGTILEGGENIRLYYETPNDQRYLLATKYLPWKANTNYVFNFNLEKREDGSFGIILPSSDMNQDVEVEFD